MIALTLMLAPVPAEVDRVIHQTQICGAGCTSALPTSTNTALGNLRTTPNAGEPAIFTATMCSKDTCTTVKGRGVIGCLKAIVNALEQDTVVRVGCVKEGEQ